MPTCDSTNNDFEFKSAIVKELFVSFKIYFQARMKMKMELQHFQLRSLKKYQPLKVHTEKTMKLDLFST